MPGGPGPVVPPPPWIPRPGGAKAAPAPHLPAAVERQVDAAARTSGLPSALLRAVVVVESRGDPWAVSPAGAEGLMQLEPPTARMLGVRDPFDPAQNTRGGARYLAELLLGYADGDTRCLRDPARCPAALRLALAAYNAGPGAVRRYGGIPPYPETRRYVALVTRWYHLFAAEERAAPGGGASSG
jgi:soluble lytic murein transglycosylase-like protein